MFYYKNLTFDFNSLFSSAILIFSHSSFVPLKFTIDKASHPLKILSPIRITLFGIVMFCKLLQQENAHSLIVVTPFGITTLSELPLYLINTPFLLQNLLKIHFLHSSLVPSRTTLIFL